MDHKRVVITGLGALTSIGIGADNFSRALRAGRSGIQNLRAENVLGFPVTQGSEVHDFMPGDWVKRLDPNTLGRASQFAIAAARQAIAQAGIDPEVLSRKICAVSIGTTDGESQAIDECIKAYVEDGEAMVSPRMLAKVPAVQLAYSVASEFRLRGEVMTIGTACAAGNYAIGNAFDLVRSGASDFALGGGAESIARKVLAGFYRVGAISPTVCSPFDLNREGMLPGEGAGMLFLESLASAKARGATILGEILGYGLSCDGKHATNPDKERIVKCMRNAHAKAGISAGQVDYICAHGTGTRVNDRTESAAIMEVFDGNPPPTGSIKSMIGHTMGAASALGAVACVKALNEKYLPPTINFNTPDPECPIDTIPNVSRPADLKIVQNNGYGFGGNNAVVIIAAYRDE